MNLENILEIINHYGVLAQLEYLQSEVAELIEAVVEYELACEAIDENDNLVFGLRAFKENIKGELADNFVMLNQLKVFYNCNIRLEDFELIDKRYNFKQLKNYSQEVYKLSLAINEAEKFKKENDRYHIFDMADITRRLEKVFEMLESFRQMYDISQEDLDEIMNFKIERQLGRINNEKATEKLEKGE